MVNNRPYNTGILVCRGQEIVATYRDPSIANYRNNPLIEALPPILRKPEVIKRLAYFPDYQDEDRHQPDHLRLHMIQNTLQFFTPLGIHLALEQTVSRLIRLGYQARNPIQIGFWKNINQSVELMDSNGFVPRSQRSTARSLTILGVSGIGKSTAIEEILYTYPQVINHNQYLDRNFSFRQLVWLKLECPQDGSIKGLCLNFFQAMDDILGTSYYKNYTTRLSTVDNLMPNVARVASIHAIGILVIDEIQNLSASKSGGASRMLNFFVQLVNTIGLPVVLVGTYKAWNVLSGEFRQIRRGTGQGDFIWDPMQEDETWQTFVKTLWRYQYVKTSCPLTPELSHALYYECQGITDFAVKLYMLAQIRAITTGKEKITESIIKSVAKDCLRTARQVLNALKETNEDRKRQMLINCEDVYPIDIEPFLEEAKTKLDFQDEKLLEMILVNQVNSVEIEPNLTTVTEPKEATRHVESKPTIKPSKHRQNTRAKNTLSEIIVQAEKQGITAYVALKQNDYIRSASEYLMEEIAG
ncbi:Tn7-like transposition protein C [Calothrix sp. NIES-2100]|uniref:ATP-binding protein n=1 Tax=Calothrix sp. NIES-2100 TaxID=1954172 RepID=UPI000B5DE684|nr:Tn7-like transposition protein C [Calothrix sp. NIES-2100]